MSLITKLQREAKANPAKAGGLGLLLLVAGYFWAPLVSGFFASDEAAPPPPAATAPGAVVPTVVAEGSKAAVSDSTGYDWHQYAKRLDHDPNAFGSVELPGDRDPFKSQSTVAPVAMVESDADASRAIAPADVGLVLSSTLVSARKKVALIGGRSYVPGQVVKAWGEKGDIIFRVVDVSSRRVLLERNGQTFELKIPRPLLDGAERVEEQPAQVLTSSREDEDEQEAAAEGSRALTN